jgi:hypothetical protein
MHGNRAGSNLRGGTIAEPGSRALLLAAPDYFTSDAQAQLIG